MNSKCTAGDKSCAFYVFYLFCFFFFSSHSLYFSFLVFTLIFVPIQSVSNCIGQILKFCKLLNYCNLFTVYDLNFTLKAVTELPCILHQILIE
jgi:hypothetical protein